DPLGVIDAYRRVKEQIPEVQLALIGSMAADDPEGLLYYAKSLRRAGEDFDVHILSNFDGVYDREVNAFQTLADIIIQKSVREGFGLVVAEALWKKKPVLGGRVGGIPLQIIEGETGYLMGDTDSYVGTCLYLLRNRDAAKEMGKKAKEHVRKNFLSTRHVRDYLNMFHSLIAEKPVEKSAEPAGAGAGAGSKQ
ncbi:MAG: glycosyltransferase, partial [Blastocatellia bacterium]